MKKTISFAFLHFGVAFSVAYAMTGSVVIGGALALVEPAVNTVVFYFQERVWERIQVQPISLRSDAAEAVSMMGAD